MILLESPTGLGIRNDAMGSGHFGAPRGGRRHNGTDFECIPGQVVKCNIDDAVVVREARPYANDPNYSGISIENDRMTIVLFYCKPLAGIIGKRVRRGQAIAEAQDISAKYGPEMTPHVHLKIEKIDPALIMAMSDFIAELKSTLKKTA